MSTPPTEPQPALPYETPRPHWDAVTVGAIVLRLLGVYCFVLAIPLVSILFFIAPRSISTFGRMDTLASLSIYAVYILAGFILIWFSQSLALALFGRSRSMRASTDPAAPGQMPVGPYLQAVAFSVAGVLICLWAIPRFGLIVSRYFGRSQSELWAMLAEPLLQIGLGVALFLGAPGLSLLWHKIRTGGTIKADQSHEGGRA